MSIKTFVTGEVLTSADTNTYLTNSGLVYLTQTTATSGSSVSVNGCFNASYRNYKILISGFTTTGAAASSVRLRSSTTDATTSYYYNGIYMSYGSTTVNGYNGSNSGSWDAGIVSDATMAGASFDLFNPYVAFVTSFNSFGSDPRTAGGGSRYASGMHYANTSYDGFTFISGSTITNITITVYGYREA
jgi:hypothetical protein